MTAAVDEDEQQVVANEVTPLKIVIGPSRSMSHTPPGVGGNGSPTHISPPTVMHNRTPVSAVPGRLIHPKKQLRKYASETCFATRPLIQPDQPSGTGTSSTRNNSDESVPSSGRDIKSSTRVYHVRPVTTVRTSNGKTVINKINRRRQDSDDVSGSIASETTVASGPTTPKHVRLKLKRPKSTGNMGYTNHIYGDTTNSGTVTVYDPSYTSATIHSFDSQQQHMLVPIEPERRASNFYMDDDSLHEFDDENETCYEHPATKTVQVVVTTDPNDVSSYRIHTEQPNGYDPVTVIAPTAAAQIQKPDPRARVFKRRNSNTLLFVPARRVSTISRSSVTSCPTEFSEDSDETHVTPPLMQIRNRSPPNVHANHITSSPKQTTSNSPQLNLIPSSPDLRRQSVQTGAPAIGFRPSRKFERRASQPTISVNLINQRHPGGGGTSTNSPQGASTVSFVNGQKTIETHARTLPSNLAGVGGSMAKRVSWMSMKSLQDSLEPLLEMKNRQREDSSFKDSRTNSQLGSGLMLNDIYDLESDTPPMDAMSWSNADEFDNVTLMYSKHEKIPMKDFGSEIRATMDIDHLLNKAVLLLDLQETSLEEIFAKIIHEMDIQEPEFTSEQVRSVLFTQDAGNQFHILSRTVQSICTTGTIGGSFDYDQTWICALCMLNTVQHRHVAIARLSHPTNLGRTMQDLRFIIIVIAPSRAKGTKTALETTRTFATLFADMDIRQRLVMAQSVEEFRSTLLEAAKELAMEQNQWRERKASIHLSQAKEQVFGHGRWFPFRGMVEDFKRRKKNYFSDYLDGIRGHRTIQKLFSTVIFLYFACLLPAIAFGVLNDDNTMGGINVRKVIFAQAVGGIFFSIFGGQPMIILLTTVPLAIYIKVIYRISEALGYDFFAMYACVGLFCQLFLIIYSATELCNLMKLATRSAEEMFSLFIAIAFIVESIRAVYMSFEHNYQVCDKVLNNVTNNSTIKLLLNEPDINKSSLNTLLKEMNVDCQRDTSILYVMLMLGTLWLSLFLYNFRKTPYLTRSRREWLADYALPASVLLMSFIGAYSFSEIDKDMFKMRPEIALIALPPILSLPWEAYFVCLLLGFFLSFLFYMDQNITSAIVNNSQNKLKKGTAIHLDLFIVAILNSFLSLAGLPWMHGALPHSPLHLRALADVEERVAQGHVHEVIMNVRETRLATLIAHFLILASTFTLLPYPLRHIPTSVLHGLFLYMALTSLTGNEMFERLLLLITEQQAYPPTHYIRRVPQRKVHLFTACQLSQLIVLCAIGFSPYPFVEMVFPIVCFLFLPIRHVLIPRLIDYKYLDALDGRH